MEVMTVSESMANSKSDQSVIPDELQALRESVLRTALLVLAIAVPLISVLFIIQLTLRGEMDFAMVMRTLFTMTFPLLAILRPRLPFSVSAVLLLALLILTGFVVSIRGGISTGNVLVNIIALVLGSLFFGRKGAVLTFLGILAAFSIAGILLVNGVMPPPDPESWNQLSAGYWLRQIIIFIVLGITLLLTQLYINEHLIALSEKARLMAEQELKQRAILEESRRMEALSRLSGGIAHDFNNTLVVMLGNAEIALMDLDDKSQTRESIEKIIAAGSSASEMTRQLLTIGRKDESAPEFIVLEKLLSRLVSSLTRLMPNHILLEYDISGTPCIFADPVMFERAFINLVLNARDAMPNGGMISVSCWVTDNMVRLAVADEGTGMDEDTLSQIYDPFFTTKGKNGTGLGLAILRAWIATTGGDITASSTLGKGSVFTLTLPLVRSTEDPKLSAIGA